MSQVTMSIRIEASAGDVWKLIGGFNSLPDWHPAVEKSETGNDGVGSIRTLSLAGGGTIVERLEQLNEKDRLYTYSIADSPLPLSDYVATLRVRDVDGKTSIVEWSSEFRPDGVPENDAVKVVEAIYSTGFENLAKIFGS